MPSVGTFGQFYGRNEDRFNISCAYRAASAGFHGAVLGGVCGAMLLAWYPDPFMYGVKKTVVPTSHNLAYIVSGLQRPILWGSMVYSIYGGVECIMEQLRDESKQATWKNSAVAGAVAGAVLGSATKRIDVMCTSALGLGMAMGVVEFSGHESAHPRPS